MKLLSTAAILLHKHVRSSFLKVAR